MFGLPDKTINLINEIFAKYPGIEKVVIYGSRARGDYKNGSDIDLTIYGGISFREKLRISGLIDDLPIPYMCDLSIFKDIKNENLTEHIERVGQIFYEREIREI
ncbi:MAG: nucleotidyltransferase domain-containing protein [Chitinispirillia bacterium]|nr:nucleotidyltransferase domain-containing protein [Chitinispirillia bacterium]